MTEVRRLVAAWVVAPPVGWLALSAVMFFEELLMFGGGDHSEWGPGAFSGMTFFFGFPLAYLCATATVFLASRLRILGSNATARYALSGMILGPVGLALLFLFAGLGGIDLASVAAGIANSALLGGTFGVVFGPVHRLIARREPVAA